MMIKLNRRAGIVFVLLSLAFCGTVAIAQESSDISATNSTVPGLERTTNFKNIKVGGEGAASSITPAATGRIYPASGELLIGVGDRLHISVFQTPEFDQDARVDPSGTIDVAGVGTVPATNRHPRDVAADIQKGLRDGGIMLHPQVTVEITDFISHGVSMQGEVRTPGIYPIIGQRRLSDLLTASGGPTELSDGEAEVRHGAGGETEHIELKKDAENFTIIPGDTITLERAPLVYILGNVRRAGGFPLARRTSLAQGLALAQGFSASAKDKKAYLFRDQGDGKRVVVQVNLHDILRGKRADMDMKPNDVLFVPNSSLADVAKAASTALPGLGVAEIYTHP
jgi:polysaccharide export outer membrane protein